MVSINASFRHVGLRTEEGEISGICLSYPDEESARAAFAVFHEYIKSPSGKKSMRVEFSRESVELYSLQVVLVMPERTFETKISGIDSSYVDRIKESLTKFTYYAILAGYEEHGEFYLLPIDEFHMFKREIVIDGEIVLGTTDCDVDWLSLLR